MKKDKEQTKDNLNADIDKFWCNNLGLSATLVSLGYDEYSIKLTDCKEIYFLFPVDFVLVESIKKYYEYELEVPAKALMDSLDALQNRIHELTKLN